MRSLALFVFAAIFISGCGSTSGTATPSGSSQQVTTSATASSEIAPIPSSSDESGDNEKLATDAPSSAVVPGVACGVERWPVKTLSDHDAAAVNTVPQDSSVHDLRVLAAPASLPQATEFRQQN